MSVITKYIGIDIGRYGAIAIIDINKGVDIHEMPSVKEKNTYMPDASAMSDIFEGINPTKTLVVVEEQQPHKKQDIKATFTLARYYESVLSTLRIFCFESNLVPPKTWKSKYGLDSDKSKSIIKMAYLYPNTAKKYIKQTENGNFNKQMDGYAEALLLADYGKRYIGKQV